MIEPALARLERVFRVAWTWLRVWAWGWPRAALAGVTLWQYRTQLRQADERRIEGTTIDRAIEADSPEGDLQLAGHRAAYTQRLDVLRQITPSTYAIELEINEVVQRIKDIDAKRFGPTLVDRPMAELGAVGQRRGFLGALTAGPAVWLGGACLALLAAFGFQTARLNHAKGDLRDARADLASAERSLADRTAERDALADNIVAAANGARESAATIERERARNAVARRRERDLLNEIQERTRNVGDPPPWDGLRDGEGSDTAGPDIDSSGHPG